MKHRCESLYTGGELNCQLKDELSSDTACTYKTSNIKIWSKARYSGISPQPSALLYTSVEHCWNARHSTYPEISQNGWTSSLLSIQRFGSDVWRKMKVLRNRITQKRSNYYINNC